MWKCKKSNMIFWWWLETWDGSANPSQVMNSKLYTTFLRPSRYLEKWKLYLALPYMFAESNSTIPNSKTVPNTHLSLRLVVPPNKLCPTKVLYFLDSVEVQFWWGWERELFISTCLLKYHFFKLSARLRFKPFQDLAFRGMSIACFDW